MKIFQISYCTIVQLPQTITVDSPSMLMLNRQIRTRVDIILPYKHNNVLVKQ